MDQPTAPASRKTIRFERILIRGSWRHDVDVGVGADGTIVSTTPTEEAQHSSTTAPETVRGWTVPGLANVHSHSFQRALVGLAEKGGQNSFWRWREVMYDFLLRLGPEDVEAVASQLFMELLKGGFTTVGEFHYLHHQPGGRPYEDPSELSRRIISAANRTGIALVHIPVVYETAGFDGAPLEGGQQRFHMDVDSLAELTGTVAADLAAAGSGSEAANHSVGWGLHSLRATSEATVADAAQAFAGATGYPVHIHVAEQIKEVEGCEAARGARPIEWLVDHADVSPNWCLIHATHSTQQERVQMATSGAAVGLCPTTEANLGDGLFSLPDYLDATGHFGVGTDSHVGRTVAGELRCLEYGQRLTLRERGVTMPLADLGADAQGVGGALFSRAARGGARALGRACGEVATGLRADFVVLDPEAASLFGRTGPEVLDSWIFSGDVSPVRDVMVGGHWVIQNGHHAKEEAILATFRERVDGLSKRL
ncbi:MAG: formimidoylglutamate deiminase [Longimicrobiales bacterium]